MNYYPAFLDLRGKKTVVVGGGRVAERKVRALLKAGALVTVISPDLTPKLLREKTKNRIEHIQRTYKKGDLKGSFLVIAATDNPSVNTAVAGDSPSIVNVVDVPHECTFIAPSVVQRGPLTIAVSTGGASPAFSKTIRKELEKAYGPEIGEYLKFVKTVRKKAFAAVPDSKTREMFFKQLASEDIFKRLRSVGAEAIKQEISEQLRHFSSS